MRRDLLGSPFIAPIPYAPPALPFDVGRESMSAEKLRQSIGRSVYEILERQKKGVKDSDEMKTVNMVQIWTILTNHR